MLPPLHFRGVVLGPSGFAAEGREWLAALEAAGFRPSLEGARLGDVDGGLRPDEEQLLARCAARSPQPESTVFHHMLVPHFAPVPAARNVLSTVFETEGLPDGWAQHAGHADVVLVKTEWAAGVFAQAGVDPAKLHVVPPPFTTAEFDAIAATARTGQKRSSEPFRWLSVFDWSLRKGHDVLLRAFAETFCAGEAELVLKIQRRDGLDTRAVAEHCCAEVQRHARSAPPAVAVIDELIDPADMARLYASADGFVLASRGEGWGRPVHEALLMALPVVATDATALRTLIPDERCGYPVRARLAPVSAAAADETPWFGGQVWHEPDVEHLGARLREVTDDPAGAAAAGRAGRRHVLELCDPERIAAELRSVLTGALLQQRA